MKFFDRDHRFASRAELYNLALDAVQDAVMCDGISIFETSADGHFLEFAATRTLVRDLLQGLRLHLGTGIAGQAALRGEGTYSNDVRAHPDFFALADQALRFETRAVLCCPMRHRKVVVGVIELVNKVSGEPFTDLELTAVQSLADGAAAFWRQQAEGKREVPRESFYELTRMLRKIVDVEGISLFTLAPRADELQLRFSDTTHRFHLEGARLNLDQGVAGSVMTSGEPLLVADVRDEPRFFQGVDTVSAFSTRSIAAAPIADLGQRLGVLEVVNGRGSEAFTKEDLLRLSRIAAEMGSLLVKLPRST